MCKHDITNKLETQKATQSSKFELALAFVVRAEELEKVVAKEDEEFYTYAINIIKWEQQIKEFRAKIQGAKTRQEYFWHNNSKAHDEEVGVGV